MNKHYLKKKNELREKAKDFQNSFAEGTRYYMSELVEITEELYNGARKYGLVKEFKENGIL